MLDDGRQLFPGDYLKDPTEDEGRYDQYEQDFQKGIALRKEGDFEASRLLLEKVVTSRTSLHGREAFDTQVAMSQLGRTLRGVDRAEEARVLHEEVLEIRRRRYGDDHEYSLNSTLVLAETLSILGQTAEAEKLSRFAQEMRGKTSARELFGGPGAMIDQDALNRAVRVSSPLAREPDCLGQPLGNSDLERLETLGGSPPRRPGNRAASGNRSAIPTWRN